MNSQGDHHLEQPTVAQASANWAGVTALAILLMSTSNVALAQTTHADGNGPVAGGTQASPATSGEAAETIVVTASKRAESVLRTPLAVTPITGEQLRQANVIGLQDLNAVVPSLEVRDSGSFGSTTFSIRGISNDDIYELASMPVAVYVDGIYIGRPDALAGVLYDIDRIEVLEGPQGTLYGRNSTAGNINIQTASPIQQFDAAADFSYGSFNDVQARGMVNVPVSDTLALRGAVAYHANDGIYNTKGSTDQNYGVSGELSGRLSALWQPTDTFKWDLVAEGYHNNGTPNIDILTGPDGKPADGQSVYDRTTSDAVQPALEANTWSVRSRMDWKILDDTTVSYLAGYQSTALRNQSVVGAYTLYRDTPSQSTSQEVDVSTDHGPLHNIFGANYYFQNYDADANSGLIPVNLYLEVQTNIKTRAYGVFDQLTYNVTDALRLIAGVRYSAEKFDVSGSNSELCPLSDPMVAQRSLRYLLGHNAALLAGDPNCILFGGFFNGGTSGNTASHRLTWKAGLAYDFSAHTSGYATVSTGFKSAGLNLGQGLSATNGQYAPENVTNYEIGLKVRAFNDRLRLNTAIYDMQYQNIQVTTLTDINNVLSNLTENAAGAQNYGAEIEYTWYLDEDTRLGGFFNYLHATYTNFHNAVDAYTGNIIPSLKGNSLANAPRYSVQARLEHDFRLPGGGMITPRATVFWQSESFLRDINSPIDRVPAWTKVDLAATYTDPSARWTVDAYVYNLGDEAVRNGGIIYGGEYISSFNSPRELGIRVALKY